MSESEARVTLWLTESLKSRIQEQYLAYGDSLSQFCRESVQFRMFAEDALEHADVSIPDDEDERKALFRAIAFDGVDAVVADEE